MQHLVLQQALIARLEAVAHSIMIQVAADLMSLVLCGFRWSFSFDSISKSWIKHPVITERRKRVILRLMQVQSGDQALGWHFDRVTHRARLMGSLSLGPVVGIASSHWTPLYDLCLHALRGCRLLQR